MNVKKNWFSSSQEECMAKRELRYDWEKIRLAGGWENGW